MPKKKKQNKKDRKEKVEGETATEPRKVKTPRNNQRQKEPKSEVKKVEPKVEQKSNFRTYKENVARDESNRVKARV